MTKSATSAFCVPRQLKSVLPEGATHAVSNSRQSTRHVKADQEAGNAIVKERANVDVLDARGIDPIRLELVKDLGGGAVAVGCGRRGEVEHGGTGQGDCDSVLRGIREPERMGRRRINVRGQWGGRQRIRGAGSETWSSSARRWGTTCRGKDAHPRCRILAERSSVLTVQGRAVELTDASKGRSEAASDIVRISFNSKLKGGRRTASTPSPPCLHHQQQPSAGT